VAVAGLEGHFNGFSNLAGLAEPGSETNGGDFGSRVERESDVPGDHCCW
jgi:hypothetical protein